MPALPSPAIAAGTAEDDTRSRSVQSQNQHGGRGSVPLRLVVMGVTGAGKSTLFNRLGAQPAAARATLFPEGAGASSKTKALRERRVGFLGDVDKPLLLVDAPGLDDTDGPGEDTRHVQAFARFLMRRAPPEAHLFLVVVNAAAPRLSQSVQDMLRTLRRVCDPDGRKRLVDYVAVVFTHVDALVQTHRSGDTFDPSARLTPQQYRSVLAQCYEKLRAEWASRVAKLLVGQGGCAEEEEVDRKTVMGIAQRCFLTESAVSPRLAEHVRDTLGRDVHRDLHQLYAVAASHARRPFQLTGLDACTKSVADGLKTEAAAMAARAAQAEKQKRQAAARVAAAAREEEAAKAAAAAAEAQKKLDEAARVAAAEAARAAEAAALAARQREAQARAQAARRRQQQQQHAQGGGCVVM